jgi:glutamine amidotransferase-like uncharacterized protein
MGYAIVYNGEGVNPRCFSHTLAQLTEYIDDRHYRVEAYSMKSDVLEREPERVKLFVIPGGNAIEMQKDLEPIAGKIHRMVTQGETNYLGICAGAIVASEKFYWGDDFVEEGVQHNSYNLKPYLSHSRTLGLYSGISALLNVHVLADLPTALNVKRADAANSQPYPLFFNSGCFFPRAEKIAKTSVLLTYADFHLRGQLTDAYDRPIEGYNEENAAAILQRNEKGNGIILSGVHPEMKATHVAEAFDQYLTIYGNRLTLEGRQQCSELREKGIKRLETMEQERKGEETMKFFFSKLSLHVKSFTSV